MPIKENKRNHDFEWEFEPRKESEQPICVSLRYHHTEDYGPTISMLYDDNSINVGYSFPAEMFLDVSDEIKRIDNLHNQKMPMKERDIPATKISLPHIGSNSGMFKTGEHQQPVQQPEHKLKNPSTSEELIEQPENGFVSFTAPTPQKKEKAEDIIAERGRSREEWEQRKEEGKKKASAKSVRRASDRESN